MYVEDLSADPTPCNRMAVDFETKIKFQCHPHTTKKHQNPANHNTQTQNKHKHLSTIRKTQNHKSFQEKEQRPKKQTTHTTKIPRKARHVKLTKRTNKKDKLFGEKMHIAMGSHFILIYVWYILPSLFQLNQENPHQMEVEHGYLQQKSGRFNTKTVRSPPLPLNHPNVNCCDFNGQ